MKLTTVLFTLALFGSTLFAQEVPTSNSCYMFEKELFAALAPSQDQCNRLAIVYQELQPQLEVLYREADEFNNQGQSLFWNLPSEAEEVAWNRKVEEVKAGRLKTQRKIKAVLDERTRNTLGVLSAQQRQLLNELDRQARVVMLFNQASGTGLIRGYNAFYMGSPTLGSADRSRRQ